MEDHNYFNENSMCNSDNKSFDSISNSFTENPKCQILKQVEETFFKIQNENIVYASTIDSSSGYIYILGDFSKELEVENQRIESEKSAVYLSKFESSGKNVFHKKIFNYNGIFEENIVKKIKMERNGKLYLIITIESLIELDDGDTFAPSSDDNFLNLIFCIDNEGEIQDIYEFYGTLSDSMNICVSKSNHLYISGYFKNQVTYVNNLISRPDVDIDPVLDILITSNTLDLNFFIGKFDMNLKLIWLKSADGKGRINLQSFEIDQCDNLILTGAFFGDILIDNYLLSNSKHSKFTLNDAWIGKLSSNGEWIFIQNSKSTKYFKDVYTKNYINPNDLEIDKYQNIYIVGDFFGSFYFKKSENVHISFCSSSFSNLEKEFQCSSNSSHSSHSLYSSHSSEESTNFNTHSEFLSNLTDSNDSNINPYFNNHHSDNHPSANYTKEYLFIAKFDKCGNILWYKNIHIFNDSQLSSQPYIVTSDDGNSYISFFNQNLEYHQNRILGNNDFVTNSFNLNIIKYDNCGKLIYSYIYDNILYNPSKPISLDMFSNKLYFIGSVIYQNFNINSFISYL